MKKIFVCLFTFPVVLFTVSCSDNGNNSEVSLTTNRDSLSYSFGVNVGSSIKQAGIDTVINFDLFLSGITSVITNNNPILTSEQSMEIIQTYFNSLRKKDDEIKKAESEKFLADNAKKEGVVTTSSGLQYKIITMGNGKKPSLQNKVKAHYTGKMVDGKVFDSSEGRDPVTFPLANVIPGWQEGIQLMPIGSKFEFYIPYNLGYGEQGYPPTIPPYSALIFEVELIGIE